MPVNPSCFTFPFSKAFSGPDFSAKCSSTLDNYEIWKTFIISKIDFSPWEVHLQHGGTGVMLHFYLKLGPETLVSKKLTLFCPFEFGQPYNLSFSAYVLGKQIVKDLFRITVLKMKARQTVQ